MQHRKWNFSMLWISPELQKPSWQSLILPLQFAMPDRVCYPHWLSYATSIPEDYFGKLSFWGLTFPESDWTRCNWLFNSFDLVYHLLNQEEVLIWWCCRENLPHLSSLTIIRSIVTVILFFYKNGSVLDHQYCSRLDTHFVWHTCNQEPMPVFLLHVNPMSFLVLSPSR